MMEIDGQPVKLAAGYIRVSTTRQSDGYSSELQRDNIKKAAAAAGYLLLDDYITEDHERGSKIARKGYQQVIEWVRAGAVSGVWVYSYDRWGRAAGEWLARMDEFRKLRVPLYSALQGEATGYILPALHAGMAQEYSAQLAAKVRPAKEASAREGKHPSITPYGYKRLYPERVGNSRYQSGLLVEDEATAWVVRELFSRYASGQWGLRALAQSLNSRGISSPRGKAWTVCNVSYILQNRTYAGQVEYNKSHHGLYETSGPNDRFVIAGRHAGIVALDTFEAVQLQTARAVRNPTRTRAGHPTAMAASLMRCSGCGGPMAVARRTDESSKRGQYVCRSRKEGTLFNGAVCSTSGYVIDLAHTALLAEVGRLIPTEGPPDDLDLTGVLPRDDSADVRAGLQRELEQAKKQRVQNVNLLTRITDPTDDEIILFRQRGAEIAAAIRSLEAQLAAVPTPVLDVAALEELRRGFLENFSLADTIARAVEARGWAALKELCEGYIESARVVDRVPENKSTWLRVEVTWRPEIQALLDCGALVLGPETQRPDYPATKAEQQRARYLRYAARKKAGSVTAKTPMEALAS